MKRNERFRLFVDYRIQTAFCLRLVFYWLICQVTLLTTVFVICNLESSSAATANSSPWRFLVPALITSFMVLPIVLLDLLIFSNRITGPLFRLNKHLQNINSGGQVCEIKFRNGDYFQNIGDGVNQLASRIVPENVVDQVNSCDPRAQSTIQNQLMIRESDVQQNAASTPEAIQG